MFRPRSVIIHRQKRIGQVLPRYERITFEKNL